MERIKAVLRRSHAVDKVAFYFEMLSFLFTVTAAAIMAITAKNPNMLLIYPLFFIGATTGLYAYYRREMVWTIALMCFYVVINAAGFIVALA